MAHPRILVFSGSARTGSYNARLASLVEQRLGENGAEVSSISLRDFPMPLYDGDLENSEGVPENAVALKRLIQQHHGVFIASPEYNAGVPPLLKNVIDWISRVSEPSEPRMAAYKGRVFALGSASTSPFGGIRGLANLRLVLETGVGALVIPEMIAVPNAADAFDPSGGLANERAATSLSAMIRVLIAEAALRKSKAA